jgi:hypothetical protein
MPHSQDILLSCAALAPSGDNTQPWRFTLADDACTIGVRIDEARDRSPMNAGQRMARLAAGAAVENIVVAASHNGWEADALPAIGGNAGLAVRLDRSGQGSGEIPSILTHRVSNRRVYRGQSIRSDELQHLQRTTGDSPGVRSIWIGDRSKLDVIGSLIGQTDAAMFGMSAVRRAFLDNIRFDRPPNEEVEEGLSLASLELERGERLGLGLLGKIPDWLFRTMKLGSSFARKAEKLVQSASGLCLIVTPGNDQATDFEVGRLMQRAWLTLTAADYAVQPMMSLPVLDGMLLAQAPCIQASPNGTTAQALSAEAGDLSGIGKNERVAAILRFGKAPPPSGRTGRRPLASVIEAMPESHEN